MSIESQTTSDAKGHGRQPEESMTQVTSRPRSLPDPASMYRRIAGDLRSGREAREIARRATVERRGRFAGDHTERGELSDQEGKAGTKIPARGAGTVPGDLPLSRLP